MERKKNHLGKSLRGKGSGGGGEWAATKTTPHLEREMIISLFCDAKKTDFLKENECCFTFTNNL